MIVWEDSPHDYNFIKLGIKISKYGLIIMS